MSDLSTFEKVLVGKFRSVDAGRSGDYALGKVIGVVALDNRVYAILQIPDTGIVFDIIAGSDVFYADEAIAAKQVKIDNGEDENEPAEAAA